GVRSWNWSAPLPQSNRSARATPSVSTTPLRLAAAQPQVRRSGSRASASAPRSGRKIISVNNDIPTSLAKDQHECGYSDHAQAPKQHSQQVVLDPPSLQVTRARAGGQQALGSGGERGIELAPVKARPRLDGSNHPCRRRRGERIEHRAIDAGGALRQSHCAAREPATERVEHTLIEHTDD